MILGRFATAQSGHLFKIQGVWQASAMSVSLQSPEPAITRKAPAGAAENSQGRKSLEQRIFQQ